MTNLRLVRPGQHYYRSMDVVRERVKAHQALKAVEAKRKKERPVWILFGTLLGLALGLLAVAIIVEFAR